MAKYEISEASYKALFRHFVEGGSEITYKEALCISDDLKKCRKEKIKNFFDKADPHNDHEENGEKIYFDVFYEDRMGAKDLGAKWDKDRKLWYAYEGTEVCDRMRMVFDVKDVDTIQGKY